MKCEGRGGWVKLNPQKKVPSKSPALLELNVQFSRVTKVTHRFDKKFAKTPEVFVCN